MEEGEAKDLEFDRDDVNALKKRLRENKLFDLTPSEERALAAAEKARKEAEERARRAAKEKARKEAEARALAEAPRGSFSFRPEALKLELKEGVEAPAKVAVAFALKMSDEAAELPELALLPGGVPVSLLVICATCSYALRSFSVLSTSRTRFGVMSSTFVTRCRYSSRMIASPYGPRLAELTA